MWSYYVSGAFCSLSVQMHCTAHRQTVLLQRLKTIAQGCLVVILQRSICATEIYNGYQGKKGSITSTTDWHPFFLSHVSPIFQYEQAVLISTRIQATPLINMPLTPNKWQRPIIKTSRYCTYVLKWASRSVRQG